MLKGSRIPFTSIKPGDKVSSNIRLVITSIKERASFESGRALCIEELGDDPGIAKGTIISHLYGGSDSFIIGIDPGARMGLVAYYRQVEVSSEVLRSITETVNRVSRLIENAPPGSKMVRIGGGKPELAKRIAGILSKRLGRAVEIELVDEKGTSSQVKGRSRLIGTRDQRSARIIAFRQGRRYLAE